MTHNVSSSLRDIILTLQESTSTTSETTSEMHSTSIPVEGSGDISETMDPGTTMETTRPTTIQNNCTDMKSPKKCKRWATRIENLHERFKENCKKSLIKWIEKLSEKEVCYSNDMMPMENTQSTTQMDDLDDGMEPCMDTYPKRKCRRILKRLNRRFNKLARKCSMTAGILKKNLMAKKVEC